MTPANCIFHHCWIATRQIKGNNGNNCCLFQQKRSLVYHADHKWCVFLMTRCILVGQALWCNPSQTSVDPPTSSGAMVGYDETSWNTLQVCCIHLPFSPSFFFLFSFFPLHCTSPKRVSGRDGDGVEGGILAHISTEGESGEGWQRGRLRSHMQNWRAPARTKALPRWTKQSLPATGGCLQEFQKFIYSGGTFFFPKLVRVLARVLPPRAYACELSAHIRVIQYPYREPWLLPETHSSNEEMKNELKNNRRKADRQNKQWESGRAMPPNMWLVPVRV